MNLKVEQMVGKDRVSSIKSVKEKMVNRENVTNNQELPCPLKTATADNDNKQQYEGEQQAPNMERVSLGSAVTSLTATTTTSTLATSTDHDITTASIDGEEFGVVEVDDNDQETVTSNATSTCHSEEIEDESNSGRNDDSITTGCNRISMLDEEENYDDEPASFQEELNEICEAFYEMVPEEDIRAYQRYVEDIQGAKVAEQALQEPAMAPEFTLQDQDGDTVDLKTLLQQGPVVLTFYRGKWCPHCNATLMRYQKYLVPALKERGATLVALSPMLPDGTAYLATKRDLEFSVCSDLNGSIADQYRINFIISEHTRPFMTKWGEHLPTHNGNDEWKIPLPATYIIGMDGRIVWSFLDNDPGIRADPNEIVAALPPCKANNNNNNNTSSSRLEDNDNSQSSLSPKSSSSRRKRLFNRKIAYTFAFPSNFGSNNNNNDNDIDSNDSAASSNKGVVERRTSLTSIKSDFGPPSAITAAARNRKAKTKERRKPKRAQSAKEFLGKYLLMGS